MKYLSLLLLTAFAVCPSYSQKTDLPAKRPTDFQLIYHVDGGMRNRSESLFISRDSCVFKKNDEGRKTIHPFRLSVKELDELYACLQKNRFDKIEYTSKEKVYDRGGSTIDVSWELGKQTLHVSNAQMNFVKDKWQSQWQAVCKYLEKYMPESK